MSFFSANTGAHTTAANDDVPRGSPITGSFPLGLTRTNHRLGLIHLPRPLPLPSFPTADSLPPTGSPVPSALLHLASLTHTHQATIMWANPYTVRRPDHRYYSDVGFFQMTNGRWLIFDLEAGRRMEFLIEFMEEPGVESLVGMGSLDIGRFLGGLQQHSGRMQVSSAVGPSGDQPRSYGGGQGNGLNRNGQNAGTVAPSHGWRASVSQPWPPRQQSVHPDTPLARTQPGRQSAYGSVPDEDEGLDLLRLNAPSRQFSQQQAIPSNQPTSSRTQPSAGQQADHTHFVKAPTATPFINPLDLPIPTGPPPRHPTNPKKRLRADRYLYPRDHEWYALNFPQAGTEYNEEDWYEHISDGSDDCQVLDSVPTVFASRGPEKEGKNSGPAVLRAGEAQHPQEIANPKAYQTEAQRAQIILAAQQLFGPNEKQRHTGEKRQREAENSNNIGKRQKTQAQPQSPQPALTYGHYPPPQGVYDNPYNAGGSRFPSVGYRHQTSAGRHPWGNQQRQGVVNSLAGQQGGQTPGGAPLVRGLQVNSVVNSRYAPAPLPVAEGTIPRYEVRPVRPISRAENDGWLLNNGGLPAADSSGIDFQIDENELREAMEYTDRLFAARAAASNATKTSPTSPANVVPQKLPSSATSNPSRLSTSQAATEQERKMPSTNSPLSNTTWMTPPTSSYPPPTLPSDLPQQKKKRPYRKQSAYWATKESPTTTTAHGKAAEPKQQHRPTYVNDSSWTPTMMEVPLNAEETQKKNISPSAPTQPAEDNPTANLTPAPQSADNDQAAVATNPIVNAFEELYKESTEKDTDSPLSQASPNTPATPPAPQPAGGRPPYIRPQGVRPGSPRDLELQEEYIRRWDLRSKIRG